MGEIDQEIFPVTSVGSDRMNTKLLVCASPPTKKPSNNPLHQAKAAASCLKPQRPFYAPHGDTHPMQGFAKPMLIMMIDLKRLRLMQKKRNVRIHGGYVSPGI